MPINTVIHCAIIGYYSIGVCAIGYLIYNQGNTLFYRPLKNWIHNNDEIKKSDIEMCVIARV